jgi:peroxiredoxin
MRRLFVNLVAVSALLAGFYLSARYYAEPVSVTQPGPSGTMVGGVRPDFKLQSHQGGLVSPADFAGKTLLINFWATWCAPCRQEMPMLMDLQREYAPLGLQVIGIALDNAESVRSFVDTFGITYPILLGEEDVFTTSAAYGNTEGVLPYSVLVDRDGIIRWQYAGQVHHEKISPLLSEVL